MRVAADFAPIWETSGARRNDSPGTAGFHARTRAKRARSDATAGGRDSDRSVDEEEPLSPPTSLRKKSRRKSDVKDPYYVSGHESDQPLPPAPFPHAPLPRKRSGGDDEVDTAFTTLNPPLHAVPPSHYETPTSLRQQHMRVMSSILHVSLARGDFKRAGRAFGLLLRAGPSTSHLDVRKNGAWNVGAEILLRREKSLEVASEGIAAPAGVEGGMAFTTKGVQDAKRFYENLILQYPYNKTHPHSIDARSFYPSLFSLMIFEASEAAKISLARARTEDSPDEDDGDSPSSQDSTVEAAVAEVKREELSAAREIGYRIDAVLLSPPYDRYAPLLRLRGMVALWEADLVDSLAATSDQDERQLDDPSSSEAGDATRARQLAQAMQRRAVDAAGPPPGRT